MAKDDAPEDLVGEEFVDYMNRQKTEDESVIKGPTAPRAASINKNQNIKTNYTPEAKIPKGQLDRQALNRKLRDEQKKEQFSKQMGEDHPTLIKGLSFGKKILGTAAAKINSSGSRFIEDQDKADKILNKPANKTKSKKEKDEEADYSNKFPRRDFDSGSTLPKSAYLPLNQFGREYQSVGIPVTYRSKPKIMEMGNMPNKFVGMPAPKGKGQKEKIATIEPRQEPQNEPYMYAPRIPDTLPGGFSMGSFKSLGNPNTNPGGLFLSFGGNKKRK